MARNFGVSYGPSENPLQRLKQGIARVESGGNYQALGPEIQRKAGTDRAYGKYQVMGANIPSWTEQALGRKLSPMEFLRSPEAQEAVFEHQMANNLRKYGTLEDAASVWFSGRPLAQAQKAGAHDVNMGVGQYVNAALGSKSAPSQGVQVAGGDDQLVQKVAAKTYSSPQEQHLMTVDLPGFSSSFTSPQEKHLMEVDLPGYSGKSVVPANAPSISTNIKMPTPVANIPPPKPEDVWGGGMEYLNAVTAGAARPIYSGISGYSPEQITAARKIYEENYPKTAMGAEIAGGITQGLAAAAVAPFALPAIAGSRLATAVPAIKRAAEIGQRALAYRPGYTGPFTSGGYIAKPGLAGEAARLGGGAAIGAVKGAAQAGANIQVHPEIPASEQLFAGSLIGTAAEPFSRYISNMPKPGFAPRLTPDARQVAQIARGKYGIEIMPWQVAKMPQELKIAAELLSPETASNQLDQFEKAVASLIEHTDSFTPDKISTRLGKIGKEIHKASFNVPIDLLSTGGGRAVRRELDALIIQANKNISSPSDRRKILKTIQNVEDTVFRRQLTGDDIQALVTKNGTINQGLPPQSNSVYQHYNGKLQDIADMVFQYATIPDKANDWRKYREMYKIAKAVEQGTTVSGKLDPKKFAQAAEDRQVSGNAKELQDIGKVMFHVTETGEPVLPKGAERAKPSMRGLADYMGVGASTIGGATLAANKLIEMGADPTGAAILGSLLGGGIYGAREGVHALSRAAQQKPFIQSSILEGKMQPLIEYGNVLAGTLPRGGLTAGFESFRGREKK